jgi:hypothetical protein
MAQNGPIIDHTAEGVPLTSTLRDSVAAYAGETLTLRKASAPSAAIRVNAGTFGLVISLFMGYPFAGAEMRIRLDGGQIGAALIQPVPVVLPARGSPPRAASSGTESRPVQKLN